MFVDMVSVTLKAGNGGDGAVRFRHEKSRHRGGPDGGDGGHGGDIVLKASPNQNTLAVFRYKKLVKAENGQPGSSGKRHGKNGSSLEVAVPLGTTVSDNEGNIIADLASEHQQIIAARGGKGGFGNAHFVSSIRQAPQVAEKGEKGEELELNLELKMIADVGIVGLPNAGKSTLLSVISNAKPEIANYPFTTLHPNLGVVDITGGQSLLFADIPGLIEGASQGKGLGDEFLRHIERTNLLVHLVDAYNEDIVKAYKTIRQELADYRVDLSKRPEIITLTKTEGFDKKELDKKIRVLEKVAPKNTEVLAISSTSGEGVQDLVRTVSKLVEKSRQKMTKKPLDPELPVIGIKEDDDTTWYIKEIKGGFLLTGKKVERFAARTHFDNYYGLQRLRDILRKMGIMDELYRQGIKVGQKIVIGDPAIGELEY